MPSEQLVPPKVTWTTAPLEVAETSRIETPEMGSWKVCPTLRLASFMSPFGVMSMSSVGFAPSHV